jgi:tetratricopeptide (TPR) repeat protein
MRRFLLVAGAAVALMAGAAQADPLDDAKAGLAALDKGDDATAIRMFTVALDSGRLTRPDRELAYVKRAQAYLAAEASDKALADANRALDLDPRDAEATATRDRAQAVLAQAKPAGAPSQGGMSSFDAAMNRYDAEKKAAADTYAQQLVAHDAQVKDIESRHAADVVAWKADVKACESGNVSKCGDAKPTATAPRPSAVAAARPAKKPVEQLTAKAPTPAPKKAAAKPTTPATDDQRPAFY